MAHFSAGTMRKGMSIDGTLEKMRLQYDEEYNKTVDKERKSVC